MTERKSLVFQGAQPEEEITKENKKTLGGDGYVCYLECSGGFLGTSMSNCIKVHILSITACQMSITPQKSCLKCFLQSPH